MCNFFMLRLEFFYKKIAVLDIDKLMQAGKCLYQTIFHSYLCNLLKLKSVFLFIYYICYFFLLVPVSNVVKV